VVEDSTEPGAGRRSPELGSATYAIRNALAHWLRSSAVELAGGAPLGILDVGCGVKPYRPFFADIAAEYVGVDLVDNPHADLIGPAEALPVGDASFDVVLCTQVLEHADDPAQVVRELRRVLKPGGVVLASTHGTWVYHPSPVDYWRWTHEGLRRLFEDNATWSDVAIAPCAGTGSTLAALAATFLEIALGRRRIARGPVALLNRLGPVLDRRTKDAAVVRPGSLILNFHVTARA
jgi:SAM-dependent methyltransferase